MKKISVIVPVYNTEKYLKKCIMSILSQKKVDLEIIIVNDGSTDNSQEIINQLKIEFPNEIKCYTKRNGGLSDARNYGVNKATGDYICFVDSDDYIYENLFENLLDYMIQGVELIKYKCIKTSKDYKEIERVNGPVFGVKSGEQAFNELYGKDVLIEPAWLYLYKRDFFLENNFQFPINMFHEDWAIVPYILLIAKTVVSTEVYGYYYIQSPNSITRNNNDEKANRRALDMLAHYDNLLTKIKYANVEERTKKNFRIYMSNCIILKLKDIPKKYQREYIKQLKLRKIVSNFKASNLKQFVKKVILRINIRLYLKIRNKL